MVLHNEHAFSEPNWKLKLDTQVAFMKNMDQVGKINACATSKSFEVWNLNRTIVAMSPLFTKSSKNDSHLTRHCSMKKLHSTFMYLPDLHRCSTGCCNNVFLIRSDYEPVCLGVGF